MRIEEEEVTGKYNVKRR